MFVDNADIRRLRAPKRKNTIEDMDDLAARYGGKCLTRVYKNMSERMVWCCKDNHEFESTPDRIRNAKQWCPECDRLAQKDKQYTEVVKRAQEFHGECLDEEFVTGVTKMSFKCNHDHEFELTPARLLKGEWCPYC